MGFLPSRMSRLLVGGHKSRMEAVIEALHAEGVLHIEDFQDPTGITGIGTPLEAGDQASALLVRVRGLLKALDAEGAAPAGAPSLDPAAELAAAEAAASQSIEALRQLRETAAKAESDLAALAPVAGIDLDLSAAGSLRSVRVFLGTARNDPSAALARTGVPLESQVAPSGTGHAVAVVVPVASAAPVERALAESGFSPIQIPPGVGTPRARLAEIEAERASLAKGLEAAEADIATLRQQWAGRLAAAEALLASQVEKTQAPLKFGVTESTFHVEGWVPRGRVKAVEEALIAKFGDAVYFHDLGDAHPLEGHGGGPEHGRGEGGNGVAHDGHEEHPGHGEHHDDGDHHDDPASDPPVHLENPKLARPYEYLLGLLGKPRYNEIDPTKLMLFFFPIFFGFMVGDVFVGAVIVAVGALLKKHKVFGIGGPAVGKALIAGGILGIAFGLFLFGEGMGFHFVVSHAQELEGEKSWETILGLHLPFADQAHGLLYKSGSALEAAAAGEHHGLLTPHSDTHLMLAGLPLGIYSKIHDVEALLILSVAAGFVHLVLGFAFGVRNVRVAHGLRLAIEEKAAWLMLIAGGILALWGGLGMRGAAGTLTYGGYALLGIGLGTVAASVILLYMGAKQVIGMGAIAFMEIPGLVGNLVSYTRLAAIGASKAGMVIALNAIGFTILGGGAPGWLLYFVGFLLIIPLAILGAGLQSLRLQFVEFFSKFYTGGGRPYVPFGRRAP